MLLFREWGPGPTLLRVTASSTSSGPFPRGPRSTTERPARTVLLFVAADVLLVLLVLVGVVLASRRAGTNEAIRDVTVRSSILAGTVEPVDVARSGDRLTPASTARLDQMVADEAERADLLRVKVWNADGVVLYSDEHRLIGQTFPLGDDELEALEEGVPTAEVSDLAKSENLYERADGKALQVYVPVRATDGEPLLFESYYPYRTVTEAAARYRSAFLSVMLGAVLVLTLLQVPLLWLVVQRLRRGQEQRERALRQAVDSSELERRRIAADLHDGVVQDLAGTALTLGGTARLLRADAGASPPRPVGDDAVAAVEHAAVETRSAIAALRSLLVEIYPPNLAEAGLAASVEGLAASLRARGVETVVGVEDVPDLDDVRQTLVFRAAQEMLRNVGRHSRAEHAWVTLRAGSGEVVLTVADDGIGPTASRSAKEPRPADAGPGGAPVGEDPLEGHFGTRLLADLSAEVGGTFELSERAGGGAEGRFTLPLG